MFGDWFPVRKFASNMTKNVLEQFDLCFNKLLIALESQFVLNVQFPVSEIRELMDQR